MAFGTMANEVDNTLHSLFRRCVECAPETPTCPACPSGDICSLVPQSCDECAHMVCIGNPTLTSDTEQKPNVAAIAGGVMGGVLFIAIAVWLFWRYWIKKRRAQQEAWEVEDEDDLAAQKGASHFKAMKSDAASTKTSRSVAASFLSRASNIIHIAYIPGVTNRNGSSHTSMMNAGPVPPIPAAFANNSSQSSTPKSPLTNQGDELFFRPSDLRDSTWSDGISLRSGKRDTQYTTHSITPSLARSSMMSEIYRDDATTEPMPATQVFRALPRMVSVKSASVASTPSVESLSTFTQGSGVKAVMLGESSNTGSPTSHHGGGTYAKATPVTISVKSKGRFPIKREASDASLATKASNPMSTDASTLVETANESDEEDEDVRARRLLIRETMAAASDSAPLIQPIESPFFDTSDLSTQPPPRPNPYAAMSASVGSGPRIKRNNSDTRGIGGLSAVIEEASKRASQDPDPDDVGGGKRASSPFSDVHASEKS